MPSAPLFQYDRFVVRPRALDDNVVRLFQVSGDFREDSHPYPGPVFLNVHEVVEPLPLSRVASRQMRAASSVTRTSTSAGIPRASMDFRRGPTW
jgi:hypothetical protein